jgi:hypothetical protein
MTPLANQPNASCTNGLLGACARTGKYVCQGTTTTVCNAPSVTAGVEVCGDNVDNDCDGSIDEPDARDARVWYQDCDGDGYASAVTAVSCGKPAPTASCANWLDARPQPSVSEDCDDYSRAYHPGADFGVPPLGKTRTDLNCDGVSEKYPRIATVYNEFIMKWTSLAICTGDCQSCYNAHGQAGGRWNAAGQAPPCSGTDVIEQFEETVQFTQGPVLTCPNSTYSQSPNIGRQLCR